VLYLERYTDKCKKQSGPPPVKDSDHPESTWKVNGYKKEGEQQKEEGSKYNNAITGV